MEDDSREILRAIKTLAQLVRFLRDELGWPIEASQFEDVEELFYDFSPEELGLDPQVAAKILEIKRLRPLSPNQPWGVFFVKFEPKRLPVVALRRILSRVALKKRPGANRADEVAWSANDLLFVSTYGENSDRNISFAHFSQSPDGRELPSLKVLGWDSRDTALHLDAVARDLSVKMSWPEDESDIEAWRTKWRSAFSIGHGEIVETSSELARRLADLAKSIRSRVDSALQIEIETGPLTTLMKAFRASLIHDLNPTSFADMYAQTITYGLLSSRITDPRTRTLDEFIIRIQTSPFLGELMGAFLRVSDSQGVELPRRRKYELDFDELGVSEVVEMLDAANMEAVIRDFGNRNPSEDPVIMFYEHFLKHYDAEMRMQRGVFYTPREVVRFIVRSIDESLRQEFGLSDGLADIATWGEVARRVHELAIPPNVSPEQEFVQILDPATGTGTFLVEVIDVVYQSLVAKWTTLGHNKDRINQLWNEYVPKHLLTRLHGYELLMAPYAIAHLKIGLKLHETGYRFVTDERVRVFLTNSLESGSVNADTTAANLFGALGQEAEACNLIKSGTRFTVVLGNPPYAGHSSNPTRHNDGSLTHAGELISRYFHFRGAPLKEKQPKWLHDDYVKFFGLTESTIQKSGIGVIGIITNHGFIRNPTFRGMRESLLSTFPRLWVMDLGGNTKKRRGVSRELDENVFDIEQGTAITIGVACPRPDLRGCYYAELSGSRADKYGLLEENTVRTTEYFEIEPSLPFLLLVPLDSGLSEEWFGYPSISELMPLHALGVVSGRDDFAISFDKSELAKRLEVFCDQRLSDSHVAKRFDIRDKGGYVLKKRRPIVRGRSARSFIRPVSYRPFDLRFMGYSRGFLTADQYAVMRYLGEPDSFAISTTKSVESGDFAHIFCTRDIMVNHCVSIKEANYVFPLYLKTLDEDAEMSLLNNQVNLAPKVLDELALAMSNDEVLHEVSNIVNPESFANYMYAVLHSPTYRSRFREFLQSEFPRIPLTAQPKLFNDLARYGSELVAFHLLESSSLGEIRDSYRGVRNPKVSRVEWSNNTVWLDTAREAGFSDVAKEVWEFRIGGYRVCEKWLKDRSGRKLTTKDVDRYQKLLAAVGATIALMEKVDFAIEGSGGWPQAFSRIELSLGKAIQDTTVRETEVVDQP